MRGASYPVLFVVLLSAQTCFAADYYPKIREVILEAEAASADIPVLRDSHALMHKAAALLSRAGYLDDAAQALKRAGGSETELIRARTLYGDTEGARRLAAAQADPERRTDLAESIADMLWRTGNHEKARIVLDDARNSSNAIVNLSHRKTRLQTIEQLSTALSSEPPNLISNEPKPTARPAAASTVPPFPVTTDGFRKRDPNALSSEARQNAEFMTRLYALAVAGNRDGLLKLTESAASPFQKMLAWANLAHVFIQLAVPVEAEQYARLISEDGADCTLAKAEALVAVGSAWGRRKEPLQAKRCFDDALHLVANVSKELAFGRAVVVARVAEAEAAVGLTSNLSAAFDLALDLARLAPPHPKPINGVYPKGYFEDNQTQDDAYRLIFNTAVKARDLPDARRSAQRWHESSSDLADSGIVTGWVEDGKMDEALAYARDLKDRGERASALLDLSQEWLDSAGAPRF
jgi:hypothetical protein